MMMAAEEGHGRIVKLLLENKADLDAKDERGKEVGEMRKGLGGGWMRLLDIHSDGDMVKEC